MPCSQLLFCDALSPLNSNVGESLECNTRRGDAGAIGDDSSRQSLPPSLLCRVINVT